MPYFVNTMRRRLLKNISGSFLIGLFVFCNTPTSVLHALFANHKDNLESIYGHDNTERINVPGINCFCNSNVVHTPYFFEYEPVVIQQPVFTYTYRETMNKTFVSLPLDFFSLRAPPVIS